MPIPDISPVLSSVDASVKPLFCDRVRSRLSRTEREEKKLPKSADPWRRALAFAFDFALIHGASVFLAEWTSLLMLRSMLGKTGKALVTNDAFQDAFSYANFYLYPAAVLFLSFVYFVAFLHLWGMSFGKGLAGIAVVNRQGETPSLDQTTRRFFGTVFSFLTCGFFFIVGMKSREQICFQDEVSGTFVVLRPVGGVRRNSMEPVVHSFDSTKKLRLIELSSETQLEPKTEISKAA